MKILYLTPQLPYPPHQGGTLRVYNLLKHIAARHEVHLLSFTASSQEQKAAAPLRDICARIETVLAPPRSKMQRLLSLFASPLPDVSTRLESIKYAALLRQMLHEEQYDVLQAQELVTAPYVMDMMTQHQLPITVFDDYNAEYHMQKLTFLTDIRAPRRWIGALYSLIQWQKLRRYEGLVCDRFDHAIAVSPEDAALLRAIAPRADIRVVPNGVDCDYFTNDYQLRKRQRRKLTDVSIVFTGKMDYRPNVDAVCWFCAEILPRITARQSAIQFYIVGRDPAPRVQQLAQSPNITVTGWVKDVRPYIAAAKVFVVPMRFGSGTRLKVLQAMAMEKAIVSTALGGSGFAPRPTDALVFAADVPAFADAVVSLLNDNAQREKLGSTARQFVLAHYDWCTIAPRLEEIYVSNSK